MTHIVHGATGAQGAPVLAALTAAGLSAAAAVRHTDSVPGAAVAVDLASGDSLAEAYAGAEGVFVHLPLASPEQQVEFAAAVVEAVRSARPGRVVFSTSGYTGDKIEPGDDQDAHSTLWRGLAESGVSYAVIAPRVYLDNFLLPVSIGPAREEGVLRYPIRDDYAISWSSHLDVADLAVRLLTSNDTEGVVSLGALPGLRGADVAAGFAKHFGRDVRFEAVSPSEYGELIIPLFGEAGAGPVIASYEHRASAPDELINEARSVQQLLGLQPRSVEAWLRDMQV